jgi:hypothetical protein
LLELWILSTVGNFTPATTGKKRAEEKRNKKSVAEEVKNRRFVDCGES